MQRISPAPAHPRKRAVVAALGIVLLAIASYAPALDAGFVFDDTALLAQGPLVQGRSPAPFWSGAAGWDYQPITNTSLWLEWRLWGASPRGFHVTNLVLHALTTVLLWRLLRRLAVPGAALGAAIFALHPVAASSVVWVSELKNVLAGVFFVATLLAWERFEARPGRRRYLAALGLFALALLSKGSVVPLPAVLVGLAWFRRGRVTRRDLAVTAPFFALSAAGAAVTVWFQWHRALAGELSTPEGLLSRASRAAWAFDFYLAKALVPLRLSIVYPHRASTPALLAALALLALTVGVALRLPGGWRRGALAALGFNALMLAPVLGFFDMSWFRVSRVGDHLQHLALMGTSGALGALVVAGLRALPDRMRSAGQAAAVALLVAFAALTNARAAVFHDELSLWRDAVQKASGSWVAQYNLATPLIERGNKDEALPHLVETIRLFPGYSEAHNNLGALLEDRGDLAGAVAEYQEAFVLRPSNAAAKVNLVNLGIRLARLGRHPEAAIAFRGVLRVAPAEADAHYNLGAALAALGDLQGAVRHLSEAVRLAPGDALARESLAAVQQAAGREAKPDRDARLP